MKNINLTLVNKLRLISSLMHKLSFPDNLQFKFNNFRHKLIKSKLQSYFNFVYSNINTYNHPKNYRNSNIIWLFWWQGEKSMPIIVEKCINSIIYENPERKIILITRFNIQRYSNIPYYIYMKVLHNKMNLAHFSDILRFNLLRNYGGIWIDSTMLCTAPLSNKYFSNIYTSGGYDNPNNYFVSSKWTSFLIGGCPGNKLFIFMDEFYKLYWKYNDYVIDYFLLDYGLSYAYKNNINGFKYYVDKHAYKNNPHLNDLIQNLNKNYNRKKYMILTKDTKLFKLSYKTRVKNNINSFYRQIINNQIP